MTDSQLDPFAARVTHPAIDAVHQERAADIQLRVADAITAFAGSMTFAPTPT